MQVIDSSESSESSEFSESSKASASVVDFRVIYYGFRREFRKMSRNAFRGGKSYYVIYGQPLIVAETSRAQ